MLVDLGRNDVGKVGGGEGAGGRGAGEGECEVGGQREQGKSSEGGSAGLRASAGRWTSRTSVATRLLCYCACLRIHFLVNHECMPPFPSAALPLLTLFHRWLCPAVWWSRS